MPGPVLGIKYWMKKTNRKWSVPTWEVPPGKNDEERDWIQRVGLCKSEHLQSAYYFGVLVPSTMSSACSTSFKLAPLHNPSRPVPSALAVSCCLQSSLRSSCPQWLRSSLPGASCDTFKSIHSSLSCDSII